MKPTDKELNLIKKYKNYLERDDIEGFIKNLENERISSRTIYRLLYLFNSLGIEYDKFIDASEIDDISIPSMYNSSQVFKQLNPLYRSGFWLKETFLSNRNKAYACDEHGEIIAHDKKDDEFMCVSVYHINSLAKHGFKIGDELILFGNRCVVISHDEILDLEDVMRNVQFDYLGDRSYRDSSLANYLKIKLQTLKENYL